MPLVRYGNGSRNATVTDGIAAKTGNNGCAHSKGGMLENIGATQAINDLLLEMKA